jgi:cytochrome c oxidase subunit 2
VVNLRALRAGKVIAMLVTKIQERLTMKNTGALIGPALLVLLTMSTTQADETAKTTYLACAACHGDTAQGNAELGAPALAGQGAEYLQRQLQHFKSGVRGGDPRDSQGAQMKAMAAPLTDGDILLLSEYLAALPQALPVAQSEGDLKNGNNYFQATCGACHGGKAEGNPGLNSPALVILDAAYLKSQYKNFQLGIRGAHPDDTYGRQMKMMSNSLPSDKDLDDVIAFIQSQAVAQ